MFVPSSELPLYSRIWIYQANRALNEDETGIINEKTKAFLEGWTAHDKMLKASFEVRYNRFLILMIDEATAGASGCSIDKSVHFIQSLESLLDKKLSFFDRTLFAFKENGIIKALSKNDFEKSLAAGELNDQTIVFN